MSEKLTYIGNCVSWPSRDVYADGGLVDMIDDAIDVSRRAFMKHVDLSCLRQLESGFGYEAHPSRGLTMAADYHVSYHRSKLHGKRCYFFKHSGIEYVFASSRP